MNKRLIGFSLLVMVCGVALVACGAAASQSPPPSGAGAAARVYEMRTYTAHPGKLADLQRRFRDHTLRIFEKHGMTNVGYWTPQDSTGANTLVYILAYPSREDATRAWAAFRVDPEWVAARTASELNGPLVVRVVSVFMDPTDFSPMK